MHHVCAWVRVCALVCHTDFSKTTTARNFLSINCPNEFSCPWKFCWFCGLKPKDKQVTAILATLSKGFIYLFGVLRRFQHCTGHITTGSWKGRGNQYIEFARVLYCKLPTNGKQLPAFPLQAMTGIEPRPQRWEARVLPLCHHGPPLSKGIITPKLLQLEVFLQICCLAVCPWL